MEAIVGVASQDGSNVAAAYTMAMKLGIKLPRIPWLATVDYIEGGPASAASPARIALGHAFRDPKLIHTVGLTFAESDGEAVSLADWSSKERQRLEFLGDATLDYCGFQ
jgi:hypothetical protein